jgi:hypothetical protein
MNGNPTLAAMLAVIAFRKWLVLPDVTYHALSDAERRLIRRKLQAVRIAA